jgi:hypothetical protein
MKMVKTFGFFICLTLIISCGGSHKEFSEPVRQNFLNDCQQGGSTPDSCQELLICIEKRMTEDNFVVEYNLYRLEGKMPFNLSSAVSNCL